MLKKSIIVFSSIALILAPTAALAKGPGNSGGKGGGQGNGQAGGPPAFVQDRVSNNQAKNVQDGAEQKNLLNVLDQNEETAHQESVIRKVGLERALENVKGTPAEEVIKYLLENRYSDEQLDEEVEEEVEEVEEEVAEEGEESEEAEEGTENESEVLEEGTEDESEQPEEDNNEESEEEVDEEESVNKHPLGKKRGLARALENVMGKPSEPVIMALITGERSVSEAARSIGQHIEETDEVDEELLEAIEGLKQFIDDADETDLTETELIEAYEEIIAAYETLSQVDKVIDSSEDLFAKVSKNEKAKERLLATYKQANQTQLKTFVKGKKPKYDVQPVIIDGRTIVPLRAISEALDADVEYAPETKTITIIRGENTINLVLNSSTATINGQEVAIDEQSSNVTAQAVQGRTMVPLRFISEALDTVVEYDVDTRTIFIEEN